jgi:hypothetical protein
LLTLAPAHIYMISDEVPTYYLVRQRSEFSSLAVNLLAVLVFGAKISLPVTIRLGHEPRPPISVLPANSINVVAPVEEAPEQSNALFGFQNRGMSTFARDRFRIAAENPRKKDMVHQVIPH